MDSKHLSHNFRGTGGSAMTNIILGIAIGILIMTFVYHCLLFKGRAKAMRDDYDKTHALLVEANRLRGLIVCLLSNPTMEISDES